MQPSISRATLREHLLLLAIVLAYGGLAEWMARVAGLPSDAVRWRLYLDGLSVLLPVSAVLALIVYLLRILLWIRPASPIDYLRQDFQSSAWRERLWAGLPIIPLLSMFMSVFSSWKVMLPQLQPFHWDASFHAWDLWLHGGIDPWRWLQPWLGRPALTSGINFFYNFWVFVIYFSLIWQAFWLGNRALRLQFLLTFLISWMLLGSFAATALSSAGPCFFGAVTSLPDPYLPLMNYLREAAASHHVWALDVQAKLWSGYSTGQVQAAAGISAMPSMHVSSTLLVTLLLWRIHPVAGGISTAFLLTILIGSVHLGWHYAIDGYLSLLVTPVIWCLCGVLARRYRGDKGE